MSVDPKKIPPLAQVDHNVVEMTCCLQCCPSWFGRAITPKPSSPAGFEPQTKTFTKNADKVNATAQAIIKK